MEIINLEHSIAKPQFIQSEPCVIALGFFDGVHKGHQRLIQTAKRIAVEKKVPLSVMTFYPHPRQIVDKNNAPVKYITPLHRKTEILKSIGVEKLYVVKFNPQFAKLKPEEFVEQYLVHAGCLHVVGGFDYTYGFKGEGNMETLKKSGEGRFGVTVVDKISFNNEKISSTLIRQLVLQGKMEAIPKYLGSFFKVSGIIVRCRKRINNTIELVVKTDDDYLLPGEGKYHVQIEKNNFKANGMIKKTAFHNQHAFLFVTIKDNSSLLVGNAVNIIWLKPIFKVDIKSEKIMIAKELLFSQSKE